MLTLDVFICSVLRSSLAIFFSIVQNFVNIEQLRILNKIFFPVSVQGWEVLLYIYISSKSDVGKLSMEVQTSPLQTFAILHLDKRCANSSLFI